MIEKVTIKINSIVYTLNKNPFGDWEIVNRAPTVAGEYPIEVVLYHDNGFTQLLNEDGITGNPLTLLVENEISTSGKKMLDYYPEVIKCLLDFQALMFTEGFEIDFTKFDLESIVSDAYLETMGKERIEQWEKLLKIVPNSSSTLENRRDTIKGRIRGNGKLNTNAINLVVSAFTNGTAESYFKDGCLNIKIKPPANNKQFIFKDVENELLRRIPAHISLNVKRDYATWGEIKTNFTSWETISGQNNWEAIELYVAP